MKALIMIAALFVVTSLQAATVSAKALNEIDSRIEMQREALQEKLSAAMNTDDVIEGKIVASIANMVEEKLATAESLLSAIDTDEKLTEENVDQINSILDESEKLIEEI